MAVKLIKISGDYGLEELEVLQEILENDYRGDIRDEGDTGYSLIAFTFPSFGLHRLPGRAKDGLRFIWVLKDDLQLVKNS